MNKSKKVLKTVIIYFCLVLATVAFLYIVSQRIYETYNDGYTDEFYGETNTVDYILFTPLFSIAYGIVSGILLKRVLLPNFIYWLILRAYDLSLIFVEESNGSALVWYFVFYSLISGVITLYMIKRKAKRKKASEVEYNELMT